MKKVKQSIEEMVINAQKNDYCFSTYLSSVFKFQISGLSGIWKGLAVLQVTSLVIQDLIF